MAKNSLTKDQKAPARSRVTKKEVKAVPEETRTITTSEIEEQERRVTMPRNASGFVFVALNRPAGICYLLRDGRHVDIGSNAAPLFGTDRGILPGKGHFGITPVAKDDWEEIKATYGQTAIFKSGRIFAHDSRDDSLAHAREMKEAKSGLEPSEGEFTEAYSDFSRPNSERCTRRSRRRL